MVKRALATTKASVPKTKPFNIGCFKFTDTGVEVDGRPTYKETEGAWDFVTRAHRSANHWMIAMIEYIDSRKDWGDKRDQLISVETGLTEKTVGVYRSIAKSVPPVNRIEGIGIGQLAVVAKLGEPEQREWLEKSRDENWSRDQLKSEIRSAKREKLISGKASGVFQIEVVLYMDVEAKSVTKAEAEAQHAGEKMIKLLDEPILKASVHAVRVR